MVEVHDQPPMPDSIIEAKIYNNKDRKTLTPKRGNIKENYYQYFR
jgi:hypothetical protein